MAADREAEADRKFAAFPFKPYPIQIDFMNALYAYLDKGGISMLESQTGRAILHIGDYAALLLDDKRYASNPAKKSSQQHPTDKLPKWIKESFVPSSDKYGEVNIHLHQFFKYNNR